MSCGRCYATGRPLSPPLRLDIFIEILLGTVRKGYEQRSDHGFGRYTEAKMGRNVAFRWPVMLRCRRLRDFSDNFTSSTLAICKRKG
jgi:hypothetical protein